GERNRQRRKILIEKMLAKKIDELLALNQAAGPARVEQLEHVLPGQLADPLLQHIEITAGTSGADEGADGATGDDIGLVAGFLERANDADMGPATGRTAAQGEADFHEVCASVAYISCTSQSLMVTVANSPTSKSAP